MIQIISILFIFSLTLHARKNTTSFPYELSLRREIPIGAAFVGTKVSSILTKKHQPLPSSAYILSLDPETLPPFDHDAIYRWSPRSSDASDILYKVGSVSPLMLSLPLLRKKQFHELLTLTVMYSEAALLIRTITGTVKYTVRRPRPYLYNPDIPMEFKLGEGKKATRAFFSGHTSNAFCGALFTATVFQELYPDSPARIWVWGGALSVATTTGVLRYYAGKHYPSDIIVGALIGSAVGFLIPRLHRTKETPVSLSLQGGRESELSIHVRF